MGSVANNLNANSLSTAHPASYNGQNPISGGNSVLGGVGGAFDQASKFSPMGATGPAGGAPNLAPIQQGTTVNNVTAAQQGAGNALGSQQNLLSALQGQNGLGAQANLSNQLAASNGVGVQNQAINGIQNVAGQYQNIASGQGPNPAMAMLNQQTGQNIQNQAALMAGQRGAGSNIGLMARQAAQQGGALQQNAVSQGATMQANQSLNALQGALAAQQAAGGLGAGLSGQQAGLANTMAGQQIGQVNANAEAQLSNQQMMQNALAGYNNAQVGNYGNVNSGNVSLANQQQQTRSGLLGGGLQGIGAVAGALFARGGEVKMASGGDPSTPGYWGLSGTGSSSSGSPSQSSFGQTLSMGDSATFQGAAKAGQSIADAIKKKQGQSQPDDSNPYGSSEYSAPGPMMSSNQSMAPSTYGYAKGGLAETGGNVEAKSPEQKAEVPGDSLANDKIPAKLSEGEFVLTREVMNSPDPVKAAAEMVAQHLKKKSNPVQNFDNGGLAVPATPDPTASPDAAMAPSPDMAQAAPPVAPTTPVAPTQPSPDTSVPDPHSYEAKVQEHMAQAQDYASGAITPETYHSLYAKKDTLGKIGTLFGLLVSGLGSGITHQPNAVLEMMNKQIENDLSSQKSTKENARNFITMQYQNNLNLANAAKIKQDALNAQIGAGYEAATTDAKMNQLKSKAGAQQGLDDYNKKSANTWKDFDAHASMLTGLPSYLKSIAPNNPAAQQVADQIVTPAAQAKADDVLKQGAVVNNLTNQKSKSSNDAIDQKRLAQIKGNSLLYKSDEDARLVDPENAIPPSLLSQVDSVETPNLNKIREQRNALNAANQELLKTPFAGKSATSVGARYLGDVLSTVSLGGGKSLADSLSGDAKAIFETKREALKTKMKDLGMSDADIENKLIGGVDDNESIPIKLKGNDEAYDTLESTAAPTLSRFKSILQAPRSESYYKKADIKKEKNKYSGVKEFGNR